MNTAHYQKLWNLIALLLFFYSVNTHLSSQGAEAIFNIKLLDDRRVPGATYGYFICSALLILLLRIGSAYAILCDSSIWQARIPTLLFDDLDHSKSSAKQFQLLSIFGVLVFPLISIIHFFRIMVTADMYSETGVKCPVYGMGIFRCSNSEQFLRHDVRIGESYTQGVDWLPVIEPLIMICLCLWILYALIKFIRCLNANSQ